MVKIDYLGLTFSAKMEVCGDCKAYLWTKESKEKLNHWLSEQKRTNRDRFVVQASLSNTAKKCLDEISKEYPGIQTSALIRAMTFIFLHFMEKPDTAEMLEMVTRSEIYESFAKQEKHIVKIQFSASGMMDLHSCSKILQIKIPKIVEEAVYRITSFHLESDP
jgi:hypothetical protein